MLSNNSSVDTEGQQPRPCKKRRLSLSRMTTTEDCEQTQRKSHFLYDIDMFVIGEDLLALPSAVEARVPGNGASIQARSEVDSREGTTQLSKKRPHSEISTDDDLRDDLRADLHLMEPGHVLVLGTSSVALIGDHDDNTPPTEPVTADSDSEVICEPDHSSESEHTPANYSDGTTDITPPLSFIAAVTDNSDTESLASDSSDCSDSDCSSDEARGEDDLYNPPTSSEAAQLSEEQNDESALPDAELEDASSGPSTVVFDPYLFIKRLPPLPEEAYSRPLALPPKSPGAPRVTLVLDLDETLVHCSAERSLDADITLSVNINCVEYQLFARKRPHLEEFLQVVSRLFEVVVFTASQSEYASKLLDILDPTKTIFSHRIYREGCIFVAGNYLKDLSILGRDLSKVIMVDNSPQAFGYQIDNGIPIPSWFDANDDTELLKLIPFLKKMNTADDVRPFIHDHYKTYKLVEMCEEQ